MTDVLDLDAARKAQADGLRKPLEVKLAGKTFKVQRPVPLSVFVAVQLGNVPEAIDGLFGKDAQRLLAAGLDVEDLKLILQEAIGKGEASASAGS